MKKILAVLMAITTLMSVMTMQSFALFGGSDVTAPEVESVRFTDDCAVSLKEVKAYFDELAEEADEEYPIEEEAYSFAMSTIPYMLEITLSNGEKVAKSPEDWLFTTFEDFDIQVDARITYNDYIEAKEKNAKTIDVEVYANTYTDIEETLEEDENNIFKIEKELVPCFVISMIPLSPLPSTVYEYADYYDVDGTKFLVTYADLSIKTLTLTAKTEEDGYISYWFEDELVYVYEWDNELAVYYLDEVYKKDVEYKEETFKSIKITECDFSASTKTLTTIKGLVEFNDGTTKNFEKIFDKPLGINDDGGTVVCTMDGFYVYVDIFDVEYSETGVNTDNYCINVYVGSDEYVEDTYKVENPNGFLLKIKLWIESFFEMLKEIFFVIINWLSF